MTRRSNPNRRTVLKTLGAGVVGGTVVTGIGAADRLPILWNADLTPVGSESNGEGTAHFKRDPAGSTMIDFTVDARRLEATPTGAHVHETGGNDIVLFEYGTPTKADDMLRVAGSFPVWKLTDSRLDGDVADVHMGGDGELKGTIKRKRSG